MRKMMVALTIAGTLLGLGAATAGADVNVRGYMRRDGVYVAPHHRTAPDNSLRNNYSTEGNANPYTGKPGWVSPDDRSDRFQLLFPNPRGLYRR